MEKKFLDNKTVIVKTEPFYPSFPYNYDSHLFSALLQLLKELGLDSVNPLGKFVKPGGTILIKPNWVLDDNFSGKGLECLITHTSLIKYFMDLSIKALQGQGTIIIGDAPLQNCNFENLKKIIKIEEIINNYQAENPQLKIFLEDWRLTKLKGKKIGKKGFFIQAQETLNKTEDEIKREYQKIDLGRESFLEEVSEMSKFFRVSNYKPSVMALHHSPGKHEYLITKRVFEADLIINLAKMKTHMKTGITAAMKNLVGFNAHKEFLPHFIKGSYLEGGDSYFFPNFFKKLFENFEDWFWETVEFRSSISNNLLKIFSKTLWFLSRISGGDKIIAGSWRGNETLWRTVLDLNHIVYFSNEKPAHILNIVDGIIAGEGEGPLKPHPKNVGILVAGWNPLYVDMAVAKMMGYCIEKIPTIYHALNHRRSKFFIISPENFETIFIEEGKPTKKKIDDLPNLDFQKPKFW